MKGHEKLGVRLKAPALEGGGDVARAALYAEGVALCHEKGGDAEEVRHDQWAHKALSSLAEVVASAHLDVLCAPARCRSISYPGGLRSGFVKQEYLHLRCREGRARAATRRPTFLLSL